MAQITIESAESLPLPEVLTLEETAAYLRVSQEDVLEAVRQQRRCIQGFRHRSRG